MASELERSVGARRGVRLVALIAIALTLSACASRWTAGRVDPAGAGPATGQPPEARGLFLLKPGDVIEVKFYYDPHLNDTVAVRLDGNISLQLVGEIFVEGMTPSELKTHLVEGYSKFIQEPEIAVIVRGFEGQKVYVGGEVASPGVIELTSRITPLQAIFKVGGFKETAQPGSIIVISKAPNGAPFVRTLDLKPVLSGKSTDDSLCLKADDVVYVPKTFIAEANKFVQQYITNMIPGNVGANFSYILYEGKQEGILK